MALIFQQEINPQECNKMSLSNGQVDFTRELISIKEKMALDSGQKYFSIITETRKNMSNDKSNATKYQLNSMENNKFIINIIDSNF